MLNNQAESLRKQGDYEKAAIFFQKALEIIKYQKISESLQSAVFTNFGLLLLNMGLYKEAVEVQRKALELDLKMGDKRNIAFSRHNLGASLFTLGKTEEALPHLEEAYRLRKLIRDYGELIHTLDILSKVHLELGNKDQARRYSEEALKLSGG